VLEQLTFDDVIRLLRGWAGTPVEVRIAGELAGLSDGHFLQTSGILVESHAGDPHQDENAIWWHLATEPQDPPPGRATFYLDRESFLSAGCDGAQDGIWLRLPGVHAQIQRTADVAFFAAS
jgi:hypothetical protein